MPIYRNSRSPFWWYTITIDGKRVRKSTGVLARKANRSLAQQVESGAVGQAQVHGVQAITQKPPVLREFAESVFLPWVKDSNSLEKKTKTYYQTGWRLLKDTPLADKRMDQITNSDCEVTTFPSSNYTANTALCTLRRIFGLAKEKRRIAFEIPAIRKRKVWGRSVAMSSADAEKIAAKMGEGDPHDVLLILRATGMRPGECYSLRWEFVNWETGCYANPRGKTLTSRRPVPLLDESLAILQRRRMTQGMPVEGWVFPSRSKSGHIVSITKAFGIARKAAGLRSKLCLYTARHGVGTDLASVISLKQVMETLGHSDARTCMRYQHPNVSALQAQLNEARVSGRIQ